MGTTTEKPNPTSLPLSGSASRRTFLKAAAVTAATGPFTAKAVDESGKGTAAVPARFPPCGTGEANMAQVNNYVAGDPAKTRDFLRAKAQDPSGLSSLPMTNTGPGQIPRKQLGSTGVHVSVMGLGGHTLGLASSYDAAERILHEAVDAGITFLDNAWEYHNGKSEEWMGKALKGRREKVFLMTKVCTHGRDKNVAMSMLEDSLRRLQTDHLDLWQIHEVIYYNDPDLHFQANGAVEALVQAKQQGKVRFIGFTGHKNPAIHLRMLELADLHRVHFDTLQMPLNCFDATFRSFEQLVLPEAQRRGMGVLGMKSLGGSGEAVLQGAVRVQEALRYAMSLPVATTISGIDSLEVLNQNLAVARDFQPYSPVEMEGLRKRCAIAAADGHLELYKTSKKFDAAVGREQHGYPSMNELPL